MSSQHQSHWHLLAQRWAPLWDVGKRSLLGFPLTRGHFSLQSATRQMKSECFLYNPHSIVQQFESQVKKWTQPFDTKLQLFP